ncbi:Similar to Ankyrin repeat and SOCS box protein 8; acc. no. Q4R544 [Pyronema omphalodes CBS 100304]|uniref:Similar to Ankyrin repeat and SOCS box protein 8 acc. no. Q4R544 n=1 Tax=Pyronema omphalodes (strain CBS 100304) TaxID=1076935 RepID=U4L2K2_PYROM|nr:Similar to Ankyrin repeat and SOCS box protein 8; acc. no. Q4R544 [Pyronema omphalodes CBS 100304]
MDEGVESWGKYGADINAWSHNDNTPLHCAAYEENVEAVRVLLEVGADINPGCKRETPLMMAIRRGYTEIEQILRDKGTLTREEAFLVESDRRRRLL